MWRKWIRDVVACFSHTPLDLLFRVDFTEYLRLFVRKYAGASELPLAIHGLVHHKYTREIVPQADGDLGKVRTKYPRQNAERRKQKQT